MYFININSYFNVWIIIIVQTSLIILNHAMSSRTMSELLDSLPRKESSHIGLNSDNEANFVFETTVFGEGISSDIIGVVFVCSTTGSHFNLKEK
jgi:hypothetical protein